MWTILSWGRAFTTEEEGTVRVGGASGKYDSKEGGGGRREGEEEEREGVDWEGDGRETEARGRG